MKKLIEELTKVNPSNLSEEGLKLFNKINEIIDKNEELEKENDNITKQLLNEILDGADYIPKSLIKEKIEELKDSRKKYFKKELSRAQYTKSMKMWGAIQVLEELLTPLKNV